MGLYQETEKFVVDVFTKAEKPTDVFHAKRTAYWVKKLKPDADEPLLVAAVAHDIERAFFGDWKKGSDNPSDLKKHQDLSAKEIEKFLRGQNADNDFIERVKHLVLAHETGGDEDQNILSDADCLSYFEEKAMRNVKKYKAEKKLLEEMKRKLDFNFQRIHSKKARLIAKKWYDDAMQELKKR